MQTMPAWPDFHRPRGEGHGRLEARYPQGDLRFGDRSTSPYNASASRLRSRALLTSFIPRRHWRTVDR